MDHYLPVRLISGTGALERGGERLAALGRRCLIVTSGTAARRCGALADAEAVLQKQGIAYTLYDGVRPNPTIASCLEGGRAAREFGAEFILGIGGGSPLDAAKIIAVSAANPELDEKGLYSMNWPAGRLPVALIGTTAGTGSEVTPVSVITDSSGRKHSFRGDLVYADLAFGDPRYTASMPMNVTASTGVDALAHCLESFFATSSNDFSRAVASTGVGLLMPPLARLAKGETPTEEDRDILYRGSIMGGMAISVTGTTLPHNLGYFLTENYGIPHGFACAVYLPALLRHAAAADPALTGELCRRADVSVDGMIEVISALTPAPDVHLTLEELEALLPRWENNASIQKVVGNVTPEQIREILTDLFCG